MTVYVVLYELTKDENSAAYKPLLDELHRLNCHRVQSSAWLANLNYSAKEVHDHFKALIDSDDSLWVNSLGWHYYFSHAKAGTNQWIRNNTSN